jgi:hypothetical protein
MYVVLPALFLWLRGRALWWALAVWDQGGGLIFLLLLMCSRALPGSGVLAS